MNTYYYYMYSKHYLQWRKCPLKYGLGLEDDDFTANELIESFNRADKISSNASYYYDLMWVNVCIVFIELFVVLAHVNEALPFKIYNIMMIVRRLLSIIFIGFGIYNLSLIRGWENQGKLAALGDAGMSCHNDKVLDATFESMANYVTSIQSGGTQFFLIFMLLVLIASFCFTTFVKFVQCDKIYKNPDADDNYTELKDGAAGTGNQIN